MYAGEEAAREKDMEQAILAGRAVVGILKHFRQKKQGGEPEKEAASLLNEETEDTPKKKGGPVFKYVAYGVGGVAAVAAGYFLWKASRS
jgi:hypothetical protein